MRARRDDHSLPVSPPRMFGGGTGLPFLPTLVPGRKRWFGTARNAIGLTRYVISKVRRGGLKSRGNLFFIQNTVHLVFRHVFLMLNIYHGKLHLF